MRQRQIGFVELPPIMRNRQNLSSNGRNLFDYVTVTFDPSLDSKKTITLKICKNWTRGVTTTK